MGMGRSGKFITVYPSNDKQALQLAVALHEATDGLPGPRIRTDRPLRPGSLVHYRYGAFRRLSAPTPNSVGASTRTQSVSFATVQVAATRIAEDGFHAPFPDVVDPFEANGIYVRNRPRKPPLAGYLVGDVLGSSACGGVYRAIDVGAYPPRACVLKEFWRDAGDLYGGLAPDWETMKQNCWPGTTVTRSSSILRPLRAGRQSFYRTGVYRRTITCPRD